MVQRVEANFWTGPYPTTSDAGKAANDSLRFAVA